MTQWSDFVSFVMSKGHTTDCMILSRDGVKYASTDGFSLRQYRTMIVQEDGTEKEESVNECNNLLALLNGKRPHQGLRLNGGKKNQILRSFDEESFGITIKIIYGKFPKGGCCIACCSKVILVGTYNELENQSSSACNDLIAVMTKYLEKIPWPN